MTCECSLYCFCHIVNIGGSDYDSQERQHSLFYLPPPPQHPPPPSEMGSPPHSPTSAVAPNWRAPPPTAVAGRQSHPRSSTHTANSRSSMRSMNGACSDCEASSYAGMSHCQRCSRPLSPPRQQLSDQQQQYMANVTRSPYIANAERQQLLAAEAQQPQQQYGYHSNVRSDARGYSPRGVASEAERTPNVPLRAYKLVPVNGHYSDAEGHMPGHIRMYLSRCDPMTVSVPQDCPVDRAVQSSLLSVNSDTASSHMRSVTLLKFIRKAVKVFLR